MKNTYKSKKRGIFGLIFGLGRLSRRSLFFLNICLPLVLVELIAFLIMLKSSSPGAAATDFPAILEYILAGLVLTVGGALVIDVSEKRD